MRRVVKLLCLTALAGATEYLAAQSTNVMRTRDTSVEVRAGERGPQLLSLRRNGERAWLNARPEKLIDLVLSGGHAEAVRWHFNANDSKVDSERVAFVYECARPKLRLTWEWRARAGTGPLEHTIRIANQSDAEIWIPMQDSFEFQMPAELKSALKLFFVEKGAGKPTATGSHEEELRAGGEWTGTSSTYAHPALGEPREVIPFVAVEDAGGGWYAGIEFSGRTRLTVQRDAAYLRGAVGLNPDPGPFRTRLRPGEIFETPTVFVGCFKGDLDGLGNTLRPWVRAVLGNPRTWGNAKYPSLVNNSWGSGMQVDAQLAQRMIRDSAELGLEMFHLDAGWFRGVGDWYPDGKKFPHGLATVAQYAHERGLKFGIWADWTQAGLDNAPGALDLRRPRVLDWTVSDLPADWKPAEFKGQTIDIGEPAAAAYTKREVFRMVEDYRLDMLEHDGYLVAQGCVRADHPHASPNPTAMRVVKDEGSYFVESSNSTDVSYHATRAYYDIYGELRKRHPEVLLEVCNDGGRMVDFGSAAHGDYFSITDSYDPLSNRQAFYDASHVLPPAMLEAYVEKWPVKNMANFRYMLRSGMLGWLTIMQDTNAWSLQEHAAAKAEIALYKRKLRPLIRDADLYHVAARPDGIGWDGIEYFDPRVGQGVVYAFRGSTEKEGEHNYAIRGLAPDKRYRLSFQDGSAAERAATGIELQRSGLTVKLAVPNSSELVFIEEIKGSYAAAEISRVQH